MTMTADELKTFLSKPNNAIVGVNRANGGPQLTTVWYAWDGEAFYFSTTRDRVKYHNIKRDPNISLIVDDLEEHRYAVAYGKAEIVEENIIDLTRLIVQKYAPPERLEQSMQHATAPGRVIVILRPDKIVTN